MEQPIGLYLKSIQCPICGKSFQTTKVKQATVKLVRRDEDFCGYYANENPTFYGVQICPNCGYGAFESDFDTIMPLEKRAVTTSITPRWQSQDYGGARTVQDAIAVHQICLLNYTIMKKKPSDIAKVCLRLAWFYRSEQNQERESHFMKFALANYRKAFEEERLELDPENQLLVNYLQGELHRRLGEYKDALYWYQEALKLPHIKTRKPIETLVRDQIITAKEQYKEATGNGSSD